MAGGDGRLGLVDAGEGFPWLRARGGKVYFAGGPIVGGSLSASE